MFAKFLICISAILACCKGLNAIETLIEGKATYFSPQEHKFRKIYSSGGMYGFEISCQAKKNIYAWLSVDSFNKKGSSLCNPHHTRISMVPLGIGLKYFMPVMSWTANGSYLIDFYYGAGLIGTHVHMHDRYPNVKQKISKWGVGGIAKLGALLNFNPFFLDLFTNYSYCPMDFNNHESSRKVYRHSMNFGGWIVGIGVGYRFGL